MVRALTVSLFLAAPVALAGQSWKNTAPESFKANAQVSGAGGGVAAVVDIKVDRYTEDAENEAIAKALKDGGHAAFVAALHKAPVIGTMTVGTRSIPIRWARQRPEGDGRQIAVVTEAPVYFIGAGGADAKPTEGFDVAVATFTVDSVGLGKGTMAPAAKVKLGGPTGVQVDDYAGKLVNLVTVTRGIAGSR
jgi:hypothetical protein